MKQSIRPSKITTVQAIARSVGAGRMGKRDRGPRVFSAFWMREILLAAQKKGIAIDDNGRGYVPTAAPRDENRYRVTALTPAGYRWEKGKLIPRKN